MGSDASKLERETMVTNGNAAMLKYMPMFLQSEFTIVGCTEHIDPMTFWIAFISYCRANKYMMPTELYMCNVEFIKYYFHQLSKETKDIYLVGSCTCNVLVGVSIGKWPGTKDTDKQAPFLTELPQLARLPF